MVTSAVQGVTSLFNPDERRRQDERRQGMNATTRANHARGVRRVSKNGIQLKLAQPASELSLSQGTESNIEFAPSKTPFAAQELAVPMPQNSNGFPRWVR